jgi:hypothetical protein
MRAEDDEIATSRLRVDQNRPDGVSVLDADAHSHARRFRRTTQRRDLSRPLPRSHTQWLVRRHNHNDRQLGVTRPTERERLAERRLCRLREVNGAKNARKFRHCNTSCSMLKR